MSGDPIDPICECGHKLAEHRPNPDVEPTATACPCLICRCAAYAPAFDDSES